MNQSDFQLAKAAMSFAATAGRISVADCDRLLAQIDPANAPEQAAPTPAPEPATVLHCQRCGRAQGDPANATCDMQPCSFS